VRSFLNRPSYGRCLLLPVLAAHTVFAQSVDVLPETLISAPRGETIGGTAPILQLLSPELESYGVDTLSDLVDALKPMTRSSRSDQTPVVLINGHLAGQAEFQTLPREAVERVEVLPETVALQYGFSENQRVLNFILRDHYRSIPVHVSDSGSTEGGNQTVSTDGSVVRLEQAARSTLYASYRDSAWLRDSQRGIEVPDSQDLTLQPAKTDVTIAGTVSGLVHGVSSSLEGSLDVASSRSLQGLGNASSELLQQGEHDVIGRLASQLTGQVGHAIWGATASFSRTQTDSASDIGFEAVGDAIADRTHSTFNTGSLQLSLSGTPLQLPAGPLVANAKLGLQYQGFDSDNAYPGAPLARSNLVRSIRSGNFNASIPLSNPGGALKLGDLSATLNVTLDNVSNVGPLWSISYGLDWVPVQKIHLDAIITEHESAPSAQDLLAPPIVTPNVEAFDYVKNETVYITEITGGGGTLAPMDDQVQNYGLSLGPFLGKTSFSAHYQQHRIRNGIGELPPLTADVEQAFPDRFVRNVNGTLIALDDRAVNLQRERIDDLKWGFNVWVPMGAPQAQRGNSNRIEFSVFDTWYLRDTILVRDGITPLNLLDGAPSDLAGGQPRHAIEFRALAYRNGIGSVLSGAWRSPTSVAADDAAAPDTLAFSSIYTMDLRIFADFERIAGTRHHGWAKGARLYLGVSNLFDRRQMVFDSTGATPLGFEGGYLDPPGRVMTVSVRKVL
jgi:hypothetical protein